MASRYAGPFPPAAHQESTPPEHRHALAVIDSLDRLWFHGSAFRPPRAFASPSPSPSSSPCLRPAPATPAPFQAIELVPRHLPSHASSSSRPRNRAADPPLPRARFDAIPQPPAAVRKRRESSWSRRSAASVPSSKQPGKSTIDRRLHEAGRKPKERLASAYRHGPGRFLEYDPPPSCQVPNVESVSGKQLTVRAIKMILSQERQEKRDWRRTSKNITEFDFDELKGIKDLGFSFNKDDLTPRVVSVFPGLRRLLQETAGINDVPGMAPMNYTHFPSGARWIQKQDALMINWQMPEEEVDMKEHLKVWARAVASVVRQEC